MARTKGTSKAPSKETFIRTIEYNEAHVAKTAGGKIYAVFNLDEAEELRTLASDVSEAKSIIDDRHELSASLSNPRQRGRRTKGVKVKHFDPEKFKHLSHGGYRIDPPADCEHKCHWEGEPAQLFWVNNITCDGTCKKKELCEHFKEFMKGSRKRIKLQNTDKINAECEWCKAKVESVDEDGSGVFACGTTYNRLEGQYTRVCEPPKKEETKPKRRRTK